LTETLIKVDPVAVIEGLFGSRKGMRTLAGMIGHAHWTVENGEEGEGNVDPNAGEVGAQPGAKAKGSKRKNSTSSLPEGKRHVFMPRGWKLKVVRDRRRRQKRKRSTEEGKKVGDV